MEPAEASLPTDPVESAAPAAEPALTPASPQEPAITTPDGYDHETSELIAALEHFAKNPEPAAPADAVPAEEPAAIDPAPEPDAVPDPEPEPEAQPIAGKRPPQRRIRTADPVEQLAIKLKQDNPDMSLKQALALAEEDFGVTPSPTSAAPIATEPTPPQPSAADIQRQIEALEEQRDQAALAFNRDEEIKAEKEIRKLQREALPEAKTRERAAQRAESEKVATEWQSDLQRATTMYPALADTESAFAVRCAEYDAYLSRNNPDLYNSPTKATLIANKVAAELGVLPEVPGAKTATPASTTPSRQTPTPPKPKSPPLPAAPVFSGNQSPSTAPTDLSVLMAQPMRADQYEEFMDNMFGRNR